MLVLFLGLHRMMRHRPEVHVGGKCQSRGPCAQVLVLFLGLHRMMWHRPGELLPFAGAREEKLREGRHLHDARRLGRALQLSQLQAAAEARLLCTAARSRDQGLQAASTAASSC